MDEANEILIERFLSGEMNDEEQQAFLDKLAGDPEFTASYENTLAALKLVKEAGRLDLKNTLEGFEKSSSETKVRTLKIRKFIPLAAVLVMALGVLMFFNLGGSLTKVEAYDTYFEPYASPSVLRDSANQDENWNLAVKYYSQGDFQLALEHLDRVKSGVHYTTVEFYQGMSYLQLEYPDYNDAAYYLNQVREDDSDYKEQANWYYGLVMLVQGRRLEAETVFKQIVKNKTYNYKKAQSLLNTKIED